MKAEEYETQIQKYDYPALRKLWQEVKAGTEPSGWDAGKAFEYLLLRAFELEGAEIVWPYSVDLYNMDEDTDELGEQIDGVVYSDHLAFLIEAKDYAKNKVAIAPIAKLRYQLLRRPDSVMGVVFSKQGFTVPAIMLASYSAPQRVLLWNGEDVSIAFEKEQMRRGLMLKFRYAVEHGLPYAPLKGVL